MNLNVPLQPTAGAHSTITFDDRRGDTRIRTVYRIARLLAESDEGLARVRNISDGGMQLSIGMALSPGDRVVIALSEALVLEGHVIWADDGKCGIQFAEGVDSRDILRRTAEEARLRTARPPRLPLSQPIVVVSERGMHVTHVYDVSQRGMKIGHDGNLAPDVSVKIILGPGIERRGTVRWVRDNLAGLILTEPFSVEELGSTKAL